MNGFTILCAGLGAVVGFLLMLIGVQGMFWGSEMKVTISGIVGLIPLLAGYGILKGVLRAMAAEGKNELD